MKNGSRSNGIVSGVQYGTLYKLLERIVIDGCNNTIVPRCGIAR
jgi:hypothetical protein